MVPKVSGAVIPISDKIDIKPEKVTRDKNGHHIMIKGKFHQEDMTFINIYATNLGPPKIQEKLIAK